MNLTTITALFNRTMNKKRIVIMCVPGPITTPFKDYSDAILLNVMPGEAYANGLMSVLFGYTSPEAN